MPPPLLGLHHVTAIAREAVENLRFYRDVLGLRLVKKTVNFDDPSAYHLYYGDETGSPGSLITFFPWAGIPPRRPGRQEIAACAFAVGAGSLQTWDQRLREAGRTPAAISERFGARVLTFSDPHGMTVELIESPGEGEAITSLAPPTMTVSREDGLADFLVEALGFSRDQSESNYERYRLSDTLDEAIDLHYTDDLPVARQGAGAIHHIALRVADPEAQLAWLEHLQSFHPGVSPVRDRQYFTSIYFQVPGNILFEIATDPPGFSVDEPIEKLGHSLQLPPQYEAHRIKIEQALPPLP